MCVLGWGGHRAGGDEMHWQEEDEFNFELFVLEMSLRSLGYWGQDGSREVWCREKLRSCQQIACSKAPGVSKAVQSVKRNGREGNSGENEKQTRTPLPLCCLNKDVAICLEKTNNPKCKGPVSGSCLSSIR